MIRSPGVATAAPPPDGGIRRHRLLRTHPTEDLVERLRLGPDSDWGFAEIRFRGDRPVAADREYLADEVSAFANADGGTLLCGVTPGGEVPGLSPARMDAIDDLLREMGLRAIWPPLRVAAGRRELGGRSLVVVEIPKGDFLHEGAGGSFLRIGSCRRRLTTDERLGLAERRGRARSRRFDEYPVPGTGFAAFDPDLRKPLLPAEGAPAPKSTLRRM